MPRVLEKLRNFRRRRRPGARKPQSRDPSDRWFRIGAVSIVIGVFAVYFWVTTARILGEPIRIDYSVSDAAFVRAMGTIVGAEFTTGNGVETLVNGDEFFPVMLDAILQAEKTITLETYIWSSGTVSDQFIEALSDRARNGVQVHVLMDGMGTLKFKQADRERLRAAGVHLLKYGRQHWWELKPNINHRTHRKLLVIDGNVGFTGGMCIDDAWLGNAHSEDVWRETQVRVEGPVVRQMQAVFATNWLQTTSRLLLGEEYFPEPQFAGTSLAQCFKSGPGEAPESARLGYMFAIAAAQKSIDISHAYFVPDDLAIDMLIEARQRGVRVRVIVPAINDSRIGRAASRSRWGKLLEAGVEFYRYLPAMFHCKTMIVDETLVTIGSANFDNRSFAINDEVTLTVLDRAVAAEHRRIFEQDLAVSEVLTREEFESRPVYVRLFDHFWGLFRSQL